jgi:hypothetical protein
MHKIYKDIFYRAAELRIENKSLRIGQSLMVAAYKIEPKFYDKIATGPFDCFYVNGRVADFLSELEKYCSELP